MLNCAESSLWLGTTEAKHSGVSRNFMTDSEKIINETKRYILEVFKSGLNKQQQTALKLKNGIDLFIGKQFADIEILKNEIIDRCEEELNE